MKNKVLFTTGIVVIIAIGAYFYFSKADKANISWRVQKVERGNLEIVVNATGTLQADTTVKVGTQVSGTIDKLFVDYNAHVKKGQLLAVLDTTALHQALQQAGVQVRTARANLLQAKLTFDRVKNLYARQLAARSDYDTDSVAYVVAKNNLQSDLTQYERAKINLGYATIRSPIDGVVLSRDVDVGQTVAASFNTPQLFSIATDLKSMQINASVDEADIGQVKVGQKVDFTVDAYPEQTFNGVVSQVRLQPVTTNNVVTYTVIIQVDNRKYELMPGMTANLTIHIQQANNILKVPMMALSFRPPRQYFAEMMKGRGRDSASRRNGNSGGYNSNGSSRPAFITDAAPEEKSGVGTVWIKNGNKVTPLKVKLGLSDGTYSEVSSDKIKAGDDVVIGAIVNSSAGQSPRSPFGRR